MSTARLGRPAACRAGGQGSAISGSIAGHRTMSAQPEVVVGNIGISGRSPRGGL
ncbi:hypothetical protein [Sorangium sp. So ce1024]|uniref:hypothetical protein n=1 Tax=unclassified Sorangium TaxID=2621164 RepID=UPI003F0C295D